MLTRDAESADFGGKRPPCWLEIPVAGIMLRDLSPPPFARCWKPDGSRAHQVFGSHRMAAPLLRMDLFPTNASVFVVIKKFLPPGNTNYGNVLATL